jgi:Ca2+-binding RTX toxin-like protein
VLRGGAGDDILDGNAYSTLIRDDDGNDDLSGGPGNDWVSYLSKTAPVRITIDNVADDGVSSINERDLVRSDVEAVTGTRYDDVLIGDDNGNRLFGTWGDDALFGRGGDDSLFGELGRDSLYGERGYDTLYQRYATPPSEADVDGKTSCGGDLDKVFSDPGDVVATDCETRYPT